MAYTDVNSRVQRVARPVWFPVSMFVTIFLWGGVIEILDFVLPYGVGAGLHGFLDAGFVNGLIVLMAIFTTMYFVWSIPVRLGYITPPPEFRRNS